MVERAAGLEGKEAQSLKRRRHACAFNNPTTMRAMSKVEALGKCPRCPLHARMHPTRMYPRTPYFASWVTPWLGSRTQHMGPSYKHASSSILAIQRQKTVPSVYPANCGLGSTVTSYLRTLLGLWHLTGKVRTYRVPATQHSVSNDMRQLLRKKPKCLAPRL